MADPKNPELLELPSDLREEALACGAPIELMGRIYRRGFNAKVGETGEFPYGKMNPSDQGELTVAVAADPALGVIKFMFGKPVAWLALPVGHARQLAKVLLEKAAEIEKKMS